MKNKARILYYDLETTPLKAWVWGCGEQHIRHGQLDQNHNMWGIICVTYCWNDDKPAKHIDYGYEEQDTAKLVSEFDEVIRQADHIIGKNNKRFDDKMLNSLRMLNGLPPMPQWCNNNDDLEKQMRRHFRLPSHALDYISHKLGLGGKIKMEMQDWIDIVEKNENGLKSFNKMIKYGKKDVEDTRKLWNYLEQYVEPRFKANVFMGDSHACTKCAGKNIIKYGTGMQSSTKMQKWYCQDCGKVSYSTWNADEAKASKAKLR